MIFVRCKVRNNLIKSRPLSRVLLSFVVPSREAADTTDVVSKERVIIRLGFLLTWMWFTGNPRDWNWHPEVHRWRRPTVEFRGAGNGRKPGSVNITSTTRYDVLHYLSLWSGLNLHFAMDFNLSENKIDFYIYVNLRKISVAKKCVCVFVCVGGGGAARWPLPSTQTLCLVISRM